MVCPVKSGKAADRRGVAVPLDRGHTVPKKARHAVKFACFLAV